MNVQESLNEVFRNVFNNDDINIQRETTANDIEGWDSLSHVNLILGVEMRFGIRFRQKEILKLKNVGDLMDLIERKFLEGKPG